MELLDLGPQNSTLRIHSIEMTNFRNIEHSKIVFPNSNVSDLQGSLPSVLGIYGQNGSGKSSVIMALGLLKQLVSGNPLSQESFNNKFLSCIRKGCDKASLMYEFCVQRFTLEHDLLSDSDKELLSKLSRQSLYEISYSFDITLADAEKQLSNSNIAIQIENEQISIKVIDDKGNIVIPKQIFIDTSDTVCSEKLQAFGSKSKYRLLTYGESSIQAKLVKEKNVAKVQSRSFVFSPEFNSIIENTVPELNKNKQIRLLRKINLYISELVLSEDEAEYTARLLVALKNLYSDDYSVNGFDYDENKLWGCLDHSELFCHFIYCFMCDIKESNNLSIDPESLLGKRTSEVLMDFVEMKTEILESLIGKDYYLAEHYFEAMGAVTTSIQHKLFVIDTTSMGIVNENRVLPLIIKTNEEIQFLPNYQTLMLNMDTTTEVEADEYPQIVSSIHKLSQVLAKIIPDLHLEVCEYMCTMESKSEIANQSSSIADFLNSTSDLSNKLTSFEVADVLDSISKTLEEFRNILELNNKPTGNAIDNSLIKKNSKDSSIRKTHNQESSSDSRTNSKYTEFSEAGIVTASEPETVDNLHEYFDDYPYYEHYVDIDGNEALEYTKEVERSPRHDRFIGSIGSATNNNNTGRLNIDIVSVRDGLSIPLKYESDGIRRLISILSPLIGVYNDPSTILAVDEIDSGIFEYLLGAILKIFSAESKRDGEKSKGQLIFTAHNLRPLEELSSKELIFTTNDPQDRFHTKTKRGNSNLRDTYLRDLFPGSSNKEKKEAMVKYENDLEQAFSLDSTGVDY